MRNTEVFFRVDLVAPTSPFRIRFKKSSQQVAELSVGRQALNSHQGLFQRAAARKFPPSPERKERNFTSPDMTSRLHPLGFLTYFAKKNFFLKASPNFTRLDIFTFYSFTPPFKSQIYSNIFFLFKMVFYEFKIYLVYKLQLGRL